MMTAKQIDRHISPHDLSWGDMCLLFPIAAISGDA